MPIMTGKELADWIGQKPQYISTNRGRRKIIPQPEDKNLYDTDHPVNAAWIKQKRAEHIVRIQAGDHIDINKRPTQKKAAPPPTKTQIPATVPRGTSYTLGLDADGNQDPGLLELDTAQKKALADLRVKELEAEKKQLELERLQGKLLDMDAAKAIIGGYMKMYGNTLFREMESYMNRVMDIYKINHTEKIKHIAGLESLMNKASSRAQSEMQKTIQGDGLKLGKK